MIVLDASVLIGYLDSSAAHLAAAEALLTASVDEDLGTNTLTLVEVLVAAVASCTPRRAVGYALSGRRADRSSTRARRAPGKAKDPVPAGERGPDAGAAT